MIGSDYILEAHNIYHTTEVRLRWKLAKFGEVFVICAWTFGGKLWLLWTFVDFWWLLWMKNDGFDSKMTIFSDRECFFGDHSDVFLSGDRETILPPNYAPFPGSLWFLRYQIMHNSNSEQSNIGLVAIIQGSAIAVFHQSHKFSLSIGCFSD